jgi:putative glutamine amidotransferase
LHLSKEREKVKPVIGINSGVAISDEGGHRYILGGNYTNAILKAGGIPVILPATQDPEVREGYFRFIDGLMLVGGPDVDPSIYGDSERLATVVPASPLRLDFDLSIARLALEKDLPVMGVCMGCQVLNVASGGSLYQDIEQQVPSYSVRHYRKIAPYYPFHQIKIARDSLLYQIMGKDIMEVNSAHHQSVKNPGNGFKISAYSEDGIVECIENPGHPFALGIQWHPEVIHERPEQLLLFCALVSAASKARSG